MEKALQQIEKYILVVTVFLLPIIVLPISPNPFIVPKLAVLVFGICLALLVRAIRILSTGKLEFSVGKFDLPVFLILIAYLISTILRTPNKMEAILLPGTATIIFAATLLYFLINQFEKEKSHFEMSLIFSGALFSIIVILSSSGLLGKIPQLPEFAKNGSFTPEGGYLPAGLFLVTLVPLGIGFLLKSKSLSEKLLVGIAGFFVVIGLIISAYNLIPGRPFAPRFPALSTSWSIAVDSLKESPILGVGPGNYLTAFNRFRPVDYNQTNLWAVKFATASNFYLSVLTEAGLLGFAALSLLLFAIYKKVKENFRELKEQKYTFTKTYKIISLILLLLLFALFPASLMPTVLLFILLAISTKAAVTSLPLMAKSESEEKNVTSKLPALIVTLPIIAGVLFLSFYSFRLLRAEYLFKKSLDSFSQNQANQTLTLMQSAVSLNPRVDRYRSTISRVYLLIANSIIQNALSAAGEGNPAQLTDEQRVNVTQLIQASIAEAKSTVALNPLRSGNWEILASTYRSLMPIAQGADAFSLQTYTQAAALDPLNPNLRISLGGIYYAAGDFDSAIKVFERATFVKPDHPNSHFNLAFAYREAGQLDKAINEMSLVLSLITDVNSQDYQIAKTALEDLQEQRGEQAPSGEELNPPQPAEEPQVEPPLDLPEDAEPPESPISPTPTPSVDDKESETGTTTPSPSNTPTPRP